MDQGLVSTDVGMLLKVASVAPPSEIPRDVSFLACGGDHATKKEDATGAFRASSGVRQGAG